MESNQLMLELDCILKTLNDLEQMVNNFKSQLKNIDSLILQNIIDEKPNEEHMLISKAINKRKKFLNKSK